MTEVASMYEKSEIASAISLFSLYFKIIRTRSYTLAAYFRIFTAINARPISCSTLDFPRTENRVKPKLAFENPKTGSTSILR